MWPGKTKKPADPDCDQRVAYATEIVVFWGADKILDLNVVPNPSSLVL